MSQFFLLGWYNKSQILLYKYRACTVREESPLPAKNLDLYTKERELSPSLLKVSLEIGWRGSWILVQLNLSGVQIRPLFLALGARDASKVLTFMPYPQV